MCVHLPARPCVCVCLRPNQRSPVNLSVSLWVYSNTRSLSYPTIPFRPSSSELWEVLSVEALLKVNKEDSEEVDYLFFFCLEGSGVNEELLFLF